MQILPHPNFCIRNSDYNTVDHIFSEAPLSKVLPRMEQGQAQSILSPFLEQSGVLEPYSTNASSSLSSLTPSLDSVF